MAMNGIARRRWRGVLRAGRPLYGRWMAFAEVLNVWMTRAIFSLVYVTVVPVVRLLQAAGGRSRKNAAAGRSLWIPRRAPGRSLEDLERMG